MEVNNELELEKYVLGALLLHDNPRSYLTMLTVEDFCMDTHKNILNEMKTCLIENRTGSMLADIGYKLDCDMYLLELTTEIITTEHLETRVKNLKDITLRKKIKGEAQVLLTKASDTELKMNEVLNESASQLKSLISDGNTIEIISTRKSLSNTMRMIDKGRESEKVEICVPYCVPYIDDKLKLLRKQLHVNSALSGIGKTAWSLSCMYQQIKAGMKVAFFCGESSKEEIIMRLLAIGSSVSFEQQLTGLKGISEAQLINFQRTLTILKDNSKNFFIYGKGDYVHDITHIGIIVEIISNKANLDMIYVDYLQNMRPPPHLKRASRWEQVEYDVMQLNNLTGELNFATTLSSQLNREAKFVDRPNMQNLKYSSTIENEAHVVSFLYREERHGEEQLPIARTEFYTDKVRLGSQVFMYLDFERNYARYQEHRPYSNDKPKWR